MATYLSTCIILEDVFISTAETLCDYFSNWSKMYLMTSLSWPNRSTSAWNISSMLNGRPSTFCVLGLDLIVADSCVIDSC